MSTSDQQSLSTKTLNVMLQPTTRWSQTNTLNVLSCFAHPGSVRRQTTGSSLSQTSSPFRIDVLHFGQHKASSDKLLQQLKIFD